MGDLLSMAKRFDVQPVERRGPARRIPCTHLHQIIVDRDAREARCSKYGAVLDPYEALNLVAIQLERRRERQGQR